MRESEKGNFNIAFQECLPFYCDFFYNFRKKCNRTTPNSESSLTAHHVNILMSSFVCSDSIYNRAFLYYRIPDCVFLTLKDVIRRINKSKGFLRYLPQKTPVFCLPDFDVSAKCHHPSIS